jgi:hypothetical protein
MSRPILIEAQLPITPPRRSYSEIDRDEIVRQTLEEAAKRIETYSGNKIYQTAWRKASLLIRSMKP